MKMNSRLIFGSGRIVSWPVSAKWNVMPTKRWDRLLTQAVELGINTFDTGRVYSSEGYFGRFIHKNGRENFNLITKGGHPGLIFKSPLTKKKIEQDLEQSFRALDTDYIDLYFFHYDDLSVDVGQLCDWSLDLLATGRIKNIGFSNMGLERFKYCSEKLRKEGVLPWLSNEFNVFQPGPERWPGAHNISANQNYLKFLIQNNIPLAAYSPLGRGYLNQQGKNKVNPQVKKIRTLSKKHQVSNSAIALNYIFNYSSKFFPIVSISSTKHLEENVKALDFELTVNEVEWLGINLTVKQNCDSKVYLRQATN